MKANGKRDRVCRRESGRVKEKGRKGIVTGKNREETKEEKGEKWKGKNEERIERQQRRRQEGS